MTIGVCGGSGSGKTTMARRLVQALGPDIATSISFDSYYKDFSELSVAERAKVNFDHPDSLDVELLVDHLTVLQNGGEVAVPVYDFSTHTRSGDLEVVPSRDFVVIEGILLFAFDEVRAGLDHLIFRDCPEPVRARRRFKRDVEDRGRTPESIRQQWETTVRPMHDIYVQPFAHHADLLTTHDDELDDILPAVVERLRNGQSVGGRS